MSDKIYHCCISGEIIPSSRVEYLLESGLPEESWTTIKHSQVRKVKGMFLQPTDLGEGEFDTSELKIVDQLYNDTVRSILRAEAKEVDPDASDDDIDDIKED